MAQLLQRWNTLIKLVLNVPLPPRTVNFDFCDPADPSAFDLSAFRLDLSGLRLDLYQIYSDCPSDCSVGILSSSSSKPYHSHLEQTTLIFMTLLTLLLLGLFTVACFCHLLFHPCFNNQTTRWPMMLPIRYCLYLKMFQIV